MRRSLTTIRPIEYSTSNGEISFDFINLISKSLICVILFVLRIFSMFFFFIFDSFSWFFSFPSFIFRFVVNSSFTLLPFILHSVHQLLFIFLMRYDNDLHFCSILIVLSILSFQSILFVLSQSFLISLNLFGYHFISDFCTYSSLVSMQFILLKRLSIFSYSNFFSYLKQS